jgi:class 3 adenylate cyclase
MDMDIEKWLHGLALQQYAATFRANGIDAEVLPELTEADLEKLGIVLGHRKRLLKAIAASRKPEAVEAVPPAGAERRQLTVMFCDLVGSTALASRLDPEDLRDVIGAYHRCVAKTVTRFGGYVAKYMGDGVLVYFGYPQAHENDAERAARTGLELVTNIAELSPRSNVQLRVRVGIATGLVVVGDLIGSGEAQERGVVGETPNLAARLQAIAEPNAVVIEPTTHRLLAGLFDYRDLGVVEAKGFSEPVRAWQALRASGIESRFEALRPAVLTPLVGREEEIELLSRLWQRARSGDGRVALLSGEPGMGKSRIAAFLCDQLQGEPHSRQRYFCSPYHTASALFPIITWFERAAAFERDDTPETRCAKLVAHLAHTATPHSAVCEARTTPGKRAWCPNGGDRAL